MQTSREVHANISMRGVASFQCPITWAFDERTLLSHVAWKFGSLEVWNWAHKGRHYYCNEIIMPLIRKLKGQPLLEYLNRTTLRLGNLPEVIWSFSKKLPLWSTNQPAIDLIWLSEMNFYSDVSIRTCYQSWKIYLKSAHLSPQKKEKKYSFDHWHNLRTTHEERSIWVSRGKRQNRRQELRYRRKFHPDFVQSITSVQRK